MKQFKMYSVRTLYTLFFLILKVSWNFAQEPDQTPAIGIKGTKCYDAFNRPQRCIPEFENAAFNVIMEATNTCGDEGPIEYCIQTGVSGIRKSCEICYPNQHSARYLTDFHSQDNQTWWQSETMLEGIQFPSQVNLTLNLGKAFDITYVRLWFYSPRPESFSIYKRACETCEWKPYQFYSASCRDTYGLPDTTATVRGDEARALCTSEYSDISPLRGGNVAFSTLEGRPSAYNFDTSPELQEWVTATAIRISLDRLNTFGDEVFGDSQVLRSYFYAIADIAVGARCKCNGHASECITTTTDGVSRRVCKCEHNTDGPDCNVCLPFYNDAPWGRASAKNAHECKACNCNGFSNRCYFDSNLYELTGHGGHCLDCSANRDGPNCERCRQDYYQREDHHCVACNCNPTGSYTLQCNSEGKCQCKPGVTGEKCDRCDVNYYDFTTYGCKRCDCSEAGSAFNRPDCDPYGGNCHCKENVEGSRCHLCKPGFFNLDLENEFGCSPCFCFGHSSICLAANGYSKYKLESLFGKGSEKWKAEDEYGRAVELQYDSYAQNIAVTAPGNEAVFFLAPTRFLGDQRNSYNRLLQFSLRIDENRAVPTSGDIILEGAGSYVTNTIFAQRNQVPSTNVHLYKFRLHEHPDYGWQPRLSARAFMSILYNLTAIRIRGTYSPRGAGFLDDVVLETALRGSAGEPALWVEYCECPTGYVGQFCESCAPGYRHSPSNGGPFSSCIPCDCNKHAEICDTNTGRCICQDNTSGDNCELCARGYYGNALAGTRDDCKPCNCPNNGTCIQLDEDAVMCVECPLGYTGHRCDFCSDGYFGDPGGRHGPATPCLQCECNFNIDPNGIGNCNTTTGECLKCIHNTGGTQCEHCLPGFYGNALALPKGDCQACQCYPSGTIEGHYNIPSCDQLSGECHCKVHVHGRNCDKCEDGYYNIISGEGCEPCNCDVIGSVNQTCDLYTGQCHCRPGVTGKHCDRCEDYRYGFSSEGCKSCDCDPIGSKGPQCDSYGQCPCLDNVEGRECNRCKENKYDRQRGCINCPECYNLVQDQARWHLQKLDRLKDILDRIERNPTVIDDAKFEDQLKHIQAEVEHLLEQAKIGTGGNGQTIAEKLADIERRQNDISRELMKVEEIIYLAHKKGEDAHLNVTYADDTIKMAEGELNEALKSLDTEGKEALDKAKERAVEFGQQSDKMTSIAQEARSLADSLDMNADHIVQTASEAMNKSTEAYELAKNATDLQRTITQDIRALKNDISVTEQKLNGVKQWTEEVHNKSTVAKNKALLLLNEISNLVIPDIDIPKLKKQVDDTKEEAKRLLNETENLIIKSEKLLYDVGEQILNSNHLLNRSIEQQDITNDILSDIDFARARANNAVTLGQGILNEAKATFETLSHFDKQVKDSQLAAEQALGRIPEIQKIIKQAVNKSREAQTSLVDSKENADRALSTAIQANELAKTASEEAQSIRSEAEFLYQNVSGLKREAGLMSERVENTENGYQKLVLETQNNETLINEANAKIGHAAKDSKEATKKVNEILQDVESIMNELQGLPNLDDADLNRLEQELLRAERKVQEANLDIVLEQLQKEHKEQHATAEGYNLQIDWLKKEVANIRDIANALPEGCFKRVELEP